MTHCLIVDDSDVVRKVARRIFERMNFEVSEAENGHEAVERCKSKTPDIVLLDWQMPVMGGIEFLGALRLAKLEKRPFIIYCMTENDPVEISRAITAGADEYLLKPFNKESIESKLGEIGLA